MKIGTLAYRTKTGLGYQVKSYIKHLGIEKILVIDLSEHNGIPLTNWYPDAPTVKGYPRNDDLEEFLKGLDVVLLAETPLNYTLYYLARKMGVKTAVVANWEFWDFYVNPHYPRPDLVIMPSVWHLEEAQEWGLVNNVKVIQLHHPVDREEFPFRLRQSASFMHVAGKPAAHDRNGTHLYLEAQPDGTVVTQSEKYAQELRTRYRHSSIYTNVEDAEFMYQLGDVMVFPRRYGGNCLPLNEALSSGMPVIMSDISPNNHLLPPEWLVPAQKTDQFEPRTIVDIFSADIDALRAKIDWFRNCDIEAESRKANEIAESISWETLKPKYMNALESL